MELSVRLCVGSIIVDALRANSPNDAPSSPTPAVPPVTWHPAAVLSMSFAAGTVVVGTTGLVETAFFTSLLSLGVSLALLLLFGLVIRRRLWAYTERAALYYAAQDIDPFRFSRVILAPIVAAILTFVLSWGAVYVAHTHALGVTVPRESITLQRENGRLREADVTEALAVVRVFHQYVDASSRDSADHLAVEIDLRTAPVKTIYSGFVGRILYLEATHDLPTSFQNSHPASIIQLRRDDRRTVDAQKELFASPHFSAFVFPSFFGKLQSFFQIAATVLAALTIALVFSRGRETDRLVDQSIFIAVMFAAVGIVASLIGSLPTLPRNVQAVLLGYVAAGLASVLSALVVQGFRSVSLRR